MINLWYIFYALVFLAKYITLVNKCLPNHHKHKTMINLNSGVKLLIGLGNPGDTYKGNRHNIGFIILDALAESFNAAPWRKNFNGSWTEIKLGQNRIMLLKPLTYMNNSGNPVADCASFYKISPEDILVIHDELDLPLGKLKVKQGGGHGGHNGIKSIAARLGKDFYRLRIGIGHPGDKNQVSDYVLGNFTSEEKPRIAEVVAAVGANSGSLLAGNFDLFMNNAAVELQEV